MSSVWYFCLKTPLRQHGSAMKYSSGNEVQLHSLEDVFAVLEGTVQNMAFSEQTPQFC